MNAYASLWTKSARALASLIVFAAAVTVSITVGFAGAPKGEEFDWRLCAEIGTALGTLLLAGYTAWLATTTRSEVALSIRQEAARNRPTLIVTPTGLSSAVFDPVSGESVPTLPIVIRNVGLGPALDLHVRAKHGDDVSSPEVIPVVAVGELIENRALSLSGIPEPSGGFTLKDLDVTGDFEDRTRATRHDVTVLTAAGLTDEVLAARALAARRVWFELIPGGVREVQFRRERVVEYQPVVQNRGSAEAESVIVELVGFDDRAQRFLADAILRMPANTQEAITVRLPAPQPALTCRLSWRDGVGPRERVFENVYPAAGHSQSFRAGAGEASG